MILSSLTLLVRRAEALLGRLDELPRLRAQVDEEHALAIFDYEILRQEADPRLDPIPSEESRQ